MKKKKQSFSELNKVKIVRLNSLLTSNVIGGTEVENTITECAYATCDEEDSDGEGEGRSGHFVCGKVSRKDEGNC